MNERKSKPKYVEPNSVKKVIEDIGSDSYQIFSKGGLLDSLKDFANEECDKTVVACSGLQNDYTYEGFTIPSGSQVIVFRDLRECNHDGKKHYNADDSIVFNTVGGHFLKVSYADSPDHYIELATISGSLDTADAYHLPTNDKGAIGEYSAEGAHWPVSQKLEIKRCRKTEK